MAKILIFGNLAESLVTFRGDLIGECCRCGHQVLACAPYINNEVRGQLAALGAESCNLAFNRVGLNPLRDLGAIAALRRMAQRFAPDYCLLYTVKPIIYGSLLLPRRSGCQNASIITGLGYSFVSAGGKARLMRQAITRLYRLALRRNAAIFFQNPDDLDLFRRLRIIDADTRTTILNGSGVNLDHFRPQPLPPAPVFLLIARLIREKGIFEYLHAARALRRTYPAARFLLVGALDPDNPAAVGMGELQEWIDDGTIEFIGTVLDVRPTLARAAVYVLPSYREGTPRTVLEALAMGRPVITTDVPGCRETVVPGRNGFLVPMRNVPALTAAMERFVREPGLAARMGRESRRLAETKYDVRQVNGVIMTELGLAINTDAASA